MYILNMLNFYLNAIFFDKIVVNIRLYVSTYYAICNCDIP